MLERQLVIPSTAGQQRETRSSSLDGVRGLAAASVVMLHLLSVFLATSIPTFAWVDRLYRVLSFTPLSLIFAGSQAVTLFFVLSGFALHRMMLKPMKYQSYLARRILRLWIPYAVSIALALASIEIFGSHKIPGQSNWMNDYLGTPITWQLLAQHALMVGTFNTKSLNFVIWSLVHEMRISLVYPVIFWAISRYRVSAVLTVSILISAAGIFLSRTHGSSQVSIYVTLSCQVYFVIGSCLSKYETKLRDTYSRMSRNLEICTFLVAVCLFCNCFKLSATYSTMLGATWLITAALCSKRGQHFLNTSFVQHLGRISYSLYLVHVVVLLAIINLLYPRISFAWLVVAALPVIVAMADLMYRAVERPSIYLSRLAGKSL